VVGLNPHQPAEFFDVVVSTRLLSMFAIGGSLLITWKLCLSAWFHLHNYAI